MRPERFDARSRAVQPQYKSEVNRDVPPARPGEFQPVPIGPMNVWPPVVLAPMAGVTNWPFRTLCREYGAGLYVSEMITARPLVEGVGKTLKLADFGPDETPRSLQLYGVDPYYVGEAVKRLVSEGRVDHIDMNFGCPVPKVTRKGGGSAIPYKRKLFERIVAAAVRATEGTDIPVTVKFRIGIDDEHRTHLDAGRIAAAEGAKAVALHARTASQRYSGTADWDEITRLKEHVTDVPVLGNGDIFEPIDAVAMMERTGCDGVVIGRGCLGRPWLFAELSALLNGRPAPQAPTLGQVSDIIIRHCELLIAHYDHLEGGGEFKGCREIRKHVAWYLRGFPAGSEIRSRMSLVTTLDELRELVGALPADAPFPTDGHGPRGESPRQPRLRISFEPRECRAAIP